jgi:hypothetical protein
LELNRPAPPKSKGGNTTLPEPSGDVQGLSDVKPGGTLKFLHVLISVALEENQILDGEAYSQWLSAFPALAKFAKVQSVFQSYSTLLLVSLPVMVWDLLPENTACSFVGYISSNDLLKDTSGLQKPMANSGKPIDQIQEAIVKLEQQVHNTPDLSGKRKYRRHPKPDTNAPERPPSAYVIFSNELREQFKSEQLSFTERARIIGERWQTLSLKEKELYKQQALVYKDEYNKNLAKYKTTIQYEQYSQYLVSFKEQQTNSSQDELMTVDSPQMEYEWVPQTDHKRKRSEEKTLFFRSDDVGEAAYETSEKGSKGPVFSQDTAQETPYLSLSPHKFEDSSPEASSTEHFDWGSPNTLPLLRISGSDQIPGLSYTRDNSPLGSSMSDSTFSTFSARSDGSHPPRSWSLRSKLTPTREQVAVSSLATSFTSIFENPFISYVQST